MGNINRSRPQQTPSRPSCKQVSNMQGFLGTIGGNSGATTLSELVGFLKQAPAPPSCSATHTPVLLRPLPPPPHSNTQCPLTQTHHPMHSQAHVLGYLLGTSCCGPLTTCYVLFDAAPGRVSSTAADVLRSGRVRILARHVSREAELAPREGGAAVRTSGQGFCHASTAPSPSPPIFAPCPGPPLLHRVQRMPLGAGSPEAA